MEETKGLNGDLCVCVSVCVRERVNLEGMCWECHSQAKIEEAPQKDALKN